MAKCKKCNKDISDSAQYCDDCLSMKDDKADEAYLDNLLNSIKDTDIPALNAYKKKSNVQQNQVEPDNNIDPEFLAKEDDIAQLLASVDLGDLLASYDNGNEKKTGNDAVEEESRDRFVQDAGNGAVEDGHEAAASGHETAYVSGLDEAYESGSGEEADDFALQAEYEYGEEAAEETGEAAEETGEAAEETGEAAADDFLAAIGYGDADDDRETAEDAAVSYEASEAYPGGTAASYGTDHGLADTVDKAEDEDDILALLNQLAPDDPIARDARAISNMLQGKPVIEENDLPKDVGKAFSDVLKVVTSLEDEADEITTLESEEKAIADTGHMEKKPQKARKQKAKRKKDKDEPHEKKSLMVKLFANVRDEKAPAYPSIDEIEDISKLKKRKKKKAKGKEQPVSVEEENISPSRRKKDEEEEQPPKIDKKAMRALKKKEKLEKKKEALKIIEELEVDEGHINKVGASIVFLFFGILVILLLIGTNIFSYSLSIKNASNYFEKKKYTEAFDEVFGMELKDEDIELYDKIATVMFVNKQLNSYNHYYAMEKYPEAMDSLLKGLARYDKYIELATILGIKSDLDYVREQIVAELDNVFNLSETEAKDILESNSRTEYSIKIYDVIIKNRWNN